MTNRLPMVVLAAALTHGQSFEVATVKLSPPPEGNLLNINLGTFRDGTLSLTNVTLNDTIKYAYELVSDEQLVGPEWNKTVRFDIVAQAPASTSPEKLHLMTRQLLAERLQLVLRSEPRVLPHLALVLGKNGPKIRTATVPQTQGNQVRGRIDHKQMPMLLLASLLSRFERQTIVDLTGLKGSDRPNLFEAVQEQLGLKLEARRGPLDVLVVTQASREPRDN